MLTCLISVRTILKHLLLKEDTPLIELRILSLVENIEHLGSLLMLLTS